MALCARTFLLALLVEAGLLEALLDLYFGLPLTFLQATTGSVRAAAGLAAHCHALSYKALHLFAELFDASAHTLASELAPHSLATSTRHAVYTEHKAHGLLAYLQALNDQVSWIGLAWLGAYIGKRKSITITKIRI